jgi:uncharacterized protein (TIGR02588 family)
MFALVTLGIIVWDGIAGDGSPPEIVVEPLAVHAHEGGYVVELLVENRGDTTAAAVAVEGTLARAGAAVETSTASFDYVPSRSQRRGGLFFTADPREYDATVRATGYAEP